MTLRCREGRPKRERIHCDAKAVTDTSQSSQRIHHSAQATKIHSSAVHDHVFKQSWELISTVGVDFTGLNSDVIQGEMGEQQSLLQELASQLELVGTDVKGLGRYLLLYCVCCAVLCCAALCCAVLCCAVLCCAAKAGLDLLTTDIKTWDRYLVLCCVVLCCAVLCCAAPCCAILRYAEHVMLCNSCCGVSLSVALWPVKCCAESCCAESCHAVHTVLCCPVPTHTFCSTLLCGHNPRTGKHTQQRQQQPVNAYNGSCLGLLSTHPFEEQLYVYTGIRTLYWPKVAVCTQSSRRTRNAYMAAMG